MKIHLSRINIKRAPKGITIKYRNCSKCYCYIDSYEYEINGGVCDNCKWCG